MSIRPNMTWVLKNYPCQESVNYDSMEYILNMEISFIAPDSLKIKGKNASVVFDPGGKADAEIVVATKPLDALSFEKVNGVRLIISGPGDYEAGGISVSGKSQKGQVIYTITEGMKIAFSDSKTADLLPDDEQYDAVIIHVTDAFLDETLSSVSAKTILLYGDLSLATVKSENTEKAAKVNLRKTSEVQGKTFLLE